MNAKQKLHSAKLTRWATLFKEQASSGLTVKAWCMEHDISIHTYNYWKHQLKMECLDSLLPSDHEIVPLTTPIITAATSGLLCPNDMLRNSRDSRDYDSISISCGNVQITIGPSVSEEKLLALLKAVRHA